MEEEMRGHRDPVGSNSLTSASLFPGVLPPVGLAETLNLQRTQRSVLCHLWLANSNFLGPFRQ